MRKPSKPMLAPSDRPANDGPATAVNGAAALSTARGSVVPGAPAAWSLGSAGAFACARIDASAATAPATALAAAALRVAYSGPLTPVPLGMVNSLAATCAEGALTAGAAGAASSASSGGIAATSRSPIDEISTDSA